MCVCPRNSRYLILIIYYSCIINLFVLFDYFIIIIIIIIINIIFYLFNYLFIYSLIYLLIEEEYWWSLSSFGQELATITLFFFFTLFVPVLWGTTIAVMEVRHSYVTISLLNIMIESCLCVGSTHFKGGMDRMERILRFFWEFSLYSSVALVN